MIDYRFFLVLGIMDARLRYIVYAIDVIGYFRGSFENGS